MYRAVELDANVLYELNTDDSHFFLENLEYSLSNKVFKKSLEITFKIPLTVTFHF